MTDSRKIYVAEDGRVVGVLYGQLYDLVAQQCRLIGLRLRSLDIVLEDDSENELAQWLQKYIETLPELKRERKTHERSLSAIRRTA